jgi:hypothetical protein
MRIVLPHPFQLKTLTFVFGVFFFAFPNLRAQETDDGSLTQAGSLPEVHSVLVVSSQHQLPEELWDALFTALHADLPEVAAEVPAIEVNPEFVRGDDPATGDVAGRAITVYLNGDCLPPVWHLPFPWGERLGWVSRVDGYVVPIIHVECKAIGEGIADRTQWMNGKERIDAMSEAIAWVVLHEWVHVARQSAAHGANGVTKASFGVNDLLCRDEGASRVTATKTGCGRLP